jgi:hypothetical protein
MMDTINPQYTSAFSKERCSGPDNDKYLGNVEAGAGRFLLSHKRLVKLLKELMILAQMF